MYDSSSKGPRRRCLGLRFIYRKGLKVAKQDGGRKNLTINNKMSLKVFQRN